MKRILVLAFVVACYQLGVTQNVSIEKSIFGVQIGFLGAWVQNESKLTDRLVLRSELGLELGFYENEDNKIDGVLLTPVIRVEPRWYYNLNKRNKKGKDTGLNGGNFVSLKTSLYPDLFTIPAIENLNHNTALSFLPMWGLRRKVGENFNFEFGLGVGYAHYFDQENINTITENGVIYDLHLRFGYNF